VKLILGQLTLFPLSSARFLLPKLSHPNENLLGLPATSTLKRLR
jgi:hypothetical protein